MLRVMLLTLVQKKTTYFTSILLLLIFTAIQLIGMLHTHPEFSARKEKVIVKTEKSSTQVSKFNIKCKICTLVFHKHQYELPLSTVFSFQLQMIKQRVYQVSNCHKLFETAVNCWTNKGPPVFS